MAKSLLTGKRSKDTSNESASVGDDPLSMDSDQIDSSIDEPNVLPNDPPTESVSINDKLVYTVAETAAILKLSKTMVYALVAAGRLQKVPFTGVSVRITKASLLSLAGINGNAVLKIGPQEPHEK